MKKLIPFLFLLLLLSACGREQIKEPDRLSAAVMTVSDSVTGESAYKSLCESPDAMLTADKINPNARDLSQYDIIYIDQSVAKLEGFDRTSVQDFVEKGGSVFLDNDLYDTFDKDFIGAEDFVTVDSCPLEMQYLNVDNNIRSLQELIYDFCTLYGNYANYKDTLANQSYGVGVVPSTAKPLASKNGLGIYTLNEYGGGYVLFTSPLLPNVSDTGAATVSANKLLRGYFAEFVSLKKYGYAVERVIGANARSAASVTVSEGSTEFDLPIETNSRPSFGDIDADGLDEIICGDAEGKIYCFKPHDELLENQGVILETGLEEINTDLDDLNSDGILDLIVGAKSGAVRVYYGHMGRYSVLFDEFVDVNTELEHEIVNRVRNNNEISAENAILLPTYSDEELLMHPASISSRSNRYLHMAAKYGSPLLFSVESETDAKKADTIINDYGYICADKKQLVKMAVAAYNTRVNAKWEGDTLSLSSETIDKNIPFYNDKYSRAVGVKIILADSAVDEFCVDAKVYYKKDNCIYTSLDGGASISKSGSSADVTITEVNLPAKISKSQKGAEVKFLDGGTMSVTVEGMAKTTSKGWEVTQQNGVTAFKKTGTAETLKIKK